MTVDINNSSTHGQRGELQRETNKDGSPGHRVEHGRMRGWWRLMRGQKGTARVEGKGEEVQRARRPQTRD